MSTTKTSQDIAPASLIPVLQRLRASPAAVLAGCLLLLGAGAGVVAAHVSVWALDETVLEQSAVHYTSNLPESLLHDANARATDRLYSLVLSIAFRLGSATSAIRFDHVLSVALFLSAAIPIYLLARRLLDSRWAAVAIALLSVALPWLTLTTALFTENLSYPLFWWAMLAGCLALSRPSIRHDALTLVAIVLLVVTRVQFLAVFAGYICAVIAVAVLRWRLAPEPRRVSPVLRATARTHAISLILVGTGLAFVIYLRMSSHWGSSVENALGTYSNVLIRGSLPPNMVEGLLVELLALALGVGLFPAIVSMTWYANRIVTPALDETYVSLLGAGVILAVFSILTVFSQFGYLGPITEERYFFYVVPTFWLGTFAALRGKTVHPRDLLLCALALAAIFGAIPFESPMTSETAFLAPSESVVQHVLVNLLSKLTPGLTVQDALAVLVMLAGVLVAFLWRRRPQVRLAWVIGLAMLLQLLITGYAYAVITGNVGGISGRTGGNISSLGWIDRITPTAHVTWLANLSTAEPPAITGEDQQRTTLFWNKSVTSWLGAPQTGVPPPVFPMSALPGSYFVHVDTTSGQVLTPWPGLESIHEVVGESASPFLQVRGTTLARAPGGGLTLAEVATPIHATWLSQGLTPSGGLTTGSPGRLYAFLSPSGRPTALHVTFMFAAPAASPGTSGPRQTAITLRLGSLRETVALTVGSTSPKLVSLTVCTPPRATVVHGSLTAIRGVAQAGTTLAGGLEHVIVASSTVRRCGR